MIYRKIIMLAVAVLFMTAAYSYACTSAVISGRVSSDGRPLLWKHRDTGELENSLRHFKGPAYSFVSLVNSSSVAGESWIGANTAGFAVMNTASYNIKDDTIPDSMMDREGILMYNALGICRNLSDFEHFLDTLSRPMGVQANFGVIDAEGGAAYYEVNNSKWVKYDVNDPSVAPDGYMVVTNFSFSGRKDDYRGYERYLTASSIFEEEYGEGEGIGTDFLFNGLSRSFRHEFLGIDLLADYRKLEEGGFTNGIAVDQDFIPRRSTSASVVVHGVAGGDDPLHTVLWTMLGYPLCSTAVPVPVSEEDHIPSYMKKNGHDSPMSSMSLYIKNKYIFRFGISSGKSYFDIGAIVSGREGFPSILSCASDSDDRIRKEFAGIYCKLLSGEIGYGRYYEMYDALAPYFFDSYKDVFSSFIADY